MFRSVVVETMCQCKNVFRPVVRHRGIIEIHFNYFVLNLDRRSPARSGAIGGFAGTRSKSRSADSLDSGNTDPVGYLQFETGFLPAYHSPEFSSRYSLNEVVSFLSLRACSFSLWLNL
jgi:hypothetical protein